MILIDASELDRLVQAIGATEDIADKALISSINRVQRWVATHSASAAAKAADVKVSAVKARVRIRFANNGDISGSVWIGLNPVAAGLAKRRPRGAKPGDNRKLRKPGVTVAGHHFPRAFIFQGTGSYDRVVQRVGTEKYRLANVLIPIDDGLDVIRSSVWPLAQKRLLDEFTRQMRFRMERASRRR